MQVDIPLDMAEKLVSETPEKVEIEDLIFQFPHLKASIVECVKQKLGEGVVYMRSAEKDTFKLPSGVEVFTVFLDKEEWSLDEEARDGEPIGSISSKDEDLPQRVFEILKECVSGIETKLPAVEKSVATREGKKAFRAMLGWKGAEGKELPEDVARNIAQFTPSKKIEGGRKKTRKTRKTRKQTTRKVVYPRV